MDKYIPLLSLVGVGIGLAVLFAQLRLFKISDTLDEILREFRRRPGGGNPPSAE